MQKKRVKKRVKSKKVRKALGAGLSAIAGLDDDPDPPETQKATPKRHETQKATPKRRVKRRSKAPPKPFFATCGVCGTANVEIAYTEADVNWEIAGHQDHYERQVGSCCSGYVIGRDLLTAAVLREVSSRLRGVDRTHHKLEKLREAVGPELGLTPGDPGEAQLIRWAEKVGVESEWLEAYT